MRSRLAFIAGFLLILSSNLSFSQVARPGLPLSFGIIEDTYVPEIKIPGNLLEEGRLKANTTIGMKPYLFAHPADTIIDFFAAARQDQLLDGSEIFRLNIASPDAYSLNVIFREFLLPDGASLYLYNADKSVVRGAYTSVNNKKSGKLATTPVAGDQLTIELNLPAGRMDFDPRIIIERVSHDFTNAFGFKSGYRESGDCNVDINCEAGDDWQLEKRAVVKFIRSGYYLCSGALINNTANDGRAIIYTANHCIGTQGQAESSVFYFNYESPECDGPNGRLDQSISGSDLLATTNKLDFALVELSLSPPLDYEPYYAGWNRIVASSNDNVTCIHHPSGDVKKITRCYGVIVTGNFGSGFDTNTHWHVPAWNLGTTEGGSSGSPLFDKDHKIIGDLTGGDAGCDYNYNDYFQKLFVCWDKYPEPEKQLKYWLDPLDNGSLVWNGYDPTSAGNPIANYDYLPEKVKVGKEVRFKDISEGQPATWEWFIENGSPSWSNKENPIVQFKKSGQATVKLIVQNEFGKDSVIQTVNVIESTAFEADQNRIVTGASVQFSNISTGEADSYSWEFEGGDPSDWEGKDPMKVTYEIPGSYDVSLILKYSAYTDTLFYRDFIKVVPETLLFSGEGISAIKSEMHIHEHKLDGVGWIAGSNSLGVDAFSNAFELLGDTLKMATGIRIPIGKLPAEVAGSYLTAVIWDDQFNEVIRDSVELISFPFPDNQTIWFRHPVGIDSLIHAGFIVPEFNDGDFCAKIATPRSAIEEGGAFARLNGNWVNLFEATGILSDLAITVETQNVFKDYKSQIKLSPVITNNRIYLDLSHLVFENFDVQIFDLTGKQIISDYKLYDRYMELDFQIIASGMYILQFRLDNLSFSKKVILVRED